MRLEDLNIGSTFWFTHAEREREKSNASKYRALSMPFLLTSKNHEFGVCTSLADGQAREYYLSREVTLTDPDKEPQPFPPTPTIVPPSYAFRRLRPDEIETALNELVWEGYELVSLTPFESLLDLLMVKY